MILLLAEVALHRAAKPGGVLHLPGALDRHGAHSQPIQVVVDQDGLGLKELLLGPLHQLLLDVPVAALAVVAVPENSAVAVAAAAARAAVAAAARVMDARMCWGLRRMLLEEARTVDGPSASHQSRRRAHGGIVVAQRQNGLD